MTTRGRPSAHACPCCGRRVPPAPREPKPKELLRSQIAWLLHAEGFDVPQIAAAQTREFGLRWDETGARGSVRSAIASIDFNIARAADRFLTSLGMSVAMDY